MNILSTTHLYVDWSRKRRSDGRRFRFRHNRRVHNFYVQVFALEIVWWYR